MYWYFHAMDIIPLVGRRLIFNPKFSLAREDAGAIENKLIDVSQIDVERLANEPIEED